MSYHGDSTSASTPATVLKDYDDGKLTYAQAQAVCVAAGMEFDSVSDTGCVPKGAPGTESAMDKEVKADTRTTLAAAAGVGLVLWLLLR
jgi:hypothetical protein